MLGLSRIYEKDVLVIQQEINHLKKKYNTDFLKFEEVQERYEIAEKEVVRATECHEGINCVKSFHSSKLDVDNNGNNDLEPDFDSFFFMILFLGVTSFVSIYMARNL
ncbi:hypothetical protein JHK82_050997 [Glycine max]|nr:hypothetical protein JHK85_051698 [Glycine max]KAG5092219.1 hypothetical protein JHK82_050997 [Glycine max]